MELSYEMQQGLVGQRLAIESHVIGVYPISYTIEECLDDFCDQVKWELDNYTFIAYDSYMGGMMMVERNPMYKSYRETLRAAEYKLRHETN